MPFSFDTFLHDLSNNTSLNSFLNNPIYVAIVIILIMLLMVYVMFRTEMDPESEYGFWTLIFRSGLYMLLPIMTIIFLHYKNIEREYEQKYDNKALTKTINASIGGKIGDEEEIIGKLDIVNNANTQEIVPKIAKTESILENKIPDLEVGDS